MTQAAPETTAERLIGTAMMTVYWLAFASLALGLILWTADHARGGLLLAGGLLGMMTLPTLRLFAVIGKARRERDWITLASTLAVLAILLALTVRDAVRLN